MSIEFNIIPCGSLAGLSCQILFLCCCETPTANPQPESWQFWDVLAIWKVVLKHVEAIANHGAHLPSFAVNSGATANPNNRSRGELQPLGVANKLVRRWIALWCFLRYRSCKKPYALTLWYIGDFGVSLAITESLTQTVHLPQSHLEAQLSRPNSHGMRWFSLVY